MYKCLILLLPHSNFLSEIRYTFDTKCNIKPLERYKLEASRFGVIKTQSGSDDRFYNIQFNEIEI